MAIQWLHCLLRHCDKTFHERLLCSRHARRLACRRARPQRIDRAAAAGILDSRVRRLRRCRRGLLLTASCVRICSLKAETVCTAASAQALAQWRLVAAVGIIVAGARGAGRVSRGVVWQIIVSVVPADPVRLVISSSTRGL